MQSSKWINWISWNNFNSAIICAINTTVLVVCCVSLSIYPEVSTKLLLPKRYFDTHCALRSLCNLLAGCSKINVFTSWLPTVSFNPCVMLISCFTNGVPCVCGTVGAGESTTHCCPRGPETSLTFTWIKSECPAQARMGGGGVSNDWCIRKQWQMRWCSKYSQKWQPSRHSIRYLNKSIPLPSCDGWQISTSSVLSCARHYFP